MLRKSEKGFSLVEVMIATAALGGLALVLLNLSKQTTKSSTKYQFDTEVTLIINEINAILSDPTKCQATFNPTGTANIVNPGSINGKYYTIGSGQAPANGYGNGGININGYALTIPATPNTDGTLSITFQNKNILKGSAGPSLLSKKINLYIQQDANGLITSCRSLSTSSADIWTRGTGANIYYNGGNVGIGTATPGTTFEVAGGIKPGSATTGTSCAPNPEGTFAYDMTAHSPVYCSDTSVWKAMGGGGASIDYTNCVTFYHSEASSGPSGCGNPTSAPYTSTGVCPNNYLPVEMSTGLRFPGSCQKAMLKCCKLQ